ncbi:MAG: QueT transporter family protein [Armatimonadota bacterium]
MNIFTLWKNTRMVVLVAVTAALYVAILLPFKFATVVPGFTEIRPGAAIPVVCSIFFGPAAAWGAAIGNLVGDIYGNMLTAGSIAGFVGNFLYGLIPFLLWRALARGEKSGLLAVRKIAAFILGCLLASAVCAVVIAVGVKYLAGAPDDVVKLLLTTIFLNNAAMSIIIGGILLVALYPAVRALGLTYHQLAAADSDTESDLENEATPITPELKG